MLARDVWPDAELGKIVAKDFVAVQVYQDKNKEVTGPIIKKYGVTGYPTFIILDSEGKELGRGGPPRNVEGAKEWFPKVADAYRNLATYEAAYKKSPDDAETATKMAEVYAAIGKSEKALEIYKKLIETTKEDDKGYTDLQLNYAKALMGTITRSNQKEVLETIVTVNEKVLPALIKAKDERAIEPGILNARIKVGISKDAEGGNALMKELEEAFGDGDRGNEIKFWAAIVTMQGGDKDAAKEKLEALVKDGDEDDKWVKKASSQLERMNKEG